MVPVPDSPARSKPADEGLPLRQAGRRLELGETNLDDPGSPAHNWAAHAEGDNSKALGARSRVGGSDLEGAPFLWTAAQDSRTAAIALSRACRPGSKGVSLGQSREFDDDSAGAASAFAPPHAVTNIAVAPIANSLDRKSISKTTNPASLLTSASESEFLDTRAAQILGNVEIALRVGRNVMR